MEFFGDEIEGIRYLDPVTGKNLESLETINIYPARHFVTPTEQLTTASENIETELQLQLNYLESQGKLVEAQRLKQRSRYDLDLLTEVGYCNGLENYSRHLTGKQPGEPPECLVNYFPPRLVISCG